MAEAIDLYTSYAVTSVAVMGILGLLIAGYLIYKGFRQGGDL